MTASSKPPAKASAFSRFIPREEIDAVAAWSFSSMDASETRVVPAPAPEPEPASVTDEVLEQRLQEARQQAYAEGFQHGHDAGSQETRDALEATIRRSAEDTAVRMGQLLHSMGDQLIASEQLIARQILELSCDIARQVVRQELKVNTRHLRAVIGEALEQMVEDGLPATVRMHPQDLALMKGALIETLGDAAPDLVADPDISPGGCLIQSPSSTVDASIEKRWSRAVGNLGLSLDWNPPQEPTDA
jgi:flagellar assembly protein FliH